VSGGAARLAWVNARLQVIEACEVTPELDAEHSALVAERARLIEADQKVRSALQHREEVFKKLSAGKSPGRGWSATNW
jgi:hypothetical protein